MVDKPALRIYGIAKENNNFKELTMSDVPGSLWRLLSGQGLLDIDSSLNVSRKEICTRVNGFCFSLFLKERGRDPG